MTFDPLDPLGIDELLSAEEIAVRDAVARLAGDRIAASVADWHERVTRAS